MKARRTTDGAQWAKERHLHRVPNLITEHLVFREKFLV